MNALPVSLRQFAGVHQFEDNRGRPTDRHLAFFPAAHRAKVTDTQQCGQLRLREAVSLADGLEFSGRHSASDRTAKRARFRVGANMGVHCRAQHNALETCLTFLTESRSVIGADVERPTRVGRTPTPLSGDPLDTPRRCFAAEPRLRGRRSVEAVDRAAGVDRFAGGLGVHLSFSLGRWGNAPFDEPLMGQNVLSVNRFLRIILHRGNP